MEMMTVKCEVTPPGRHRRGEDDASSMVKKCVKRRRRDHSATVPLGCDDQQQQQQGDQPSTATIVKRSSRFRGVSRHRWTGRFEAHLWDKGTWNATQKKKGKQVYLGAYDEEESAARAYDLAALKYWGATTFTNFPVSDYEKEIEIMQNVTREEYLASLRRKSSGFSRGVSRYRGVARHHHNGRWEARIGRVFGNKYLYLGTYTTQEEAAQAYDIAAIEYRGINAVTNFDLSTYIRWLRHGTNPVAASQDQPPSIKAEYQAIPSSKNIKPTENPESTLFHTNPLISNNMNSPQTQENFQRKVPISPGNKPTSPTALSLLLRSSMFRELVEKNSSFNDDEIEGDETRQQLQMGSEDEYGEILYNGIGEIPYVFSHKDDTDTLPSMELQEESGSSFYNRQSLWNGALNMSPIY